MQRKICLIVGLLAAMAALALPAPGRAQPPVCPPGYDWYWGACRPIPPPPPPPAPVPPYYDYAPPRSPGDRAMSQAYCNQQQAACANACNNHTYGQERNVCYDQCNAQYVNCTAWNTVR